MYTFSPTYKIGRVKKGLHLIPIILFRTRVGPLTYLCGFLQMSCKSLAELWHMSVCVGCRRQSIYQTESCSILCCKCNHSKSVKYKLYHYCKHFNDMCIRKNKNNSKYCLNMYPNIRVSSHFMANSFWVYDYHILGETPCAHGVRAHPPQPCHHS